MDGGDDQCTARTAVTPQSRSRRRPGRVKLRVLSGSRAGTEYVVDRTRVRVGRSRTADVTIDDDSVSGLHFDLRLTPRGIEVVDLGSTNGTSLFDRQIGRAVILPGDTIAAGSCKIQLVGVDDIDVDELDELRDDGLVGASDVMRELFATTDKLSGTRLSVLVCGETGTGKDLIARALHRRSARGGGPFVVLDCAALSSPLADSIIYGHVQGAFTDAGEDRPGAFEQADGGTLLLDEIGELSLALQGKLLGALSRGEVTRVGDHRARTVDVRVVATTHRDLREMIQRGAFREDLYFRLAQAVLEVPPLRERGDDVERIARVFLTRMEERDGVRRRLAPEALALLREHRWSGNVRELSNALDRGAALSDDGTIRPDDLALDLHERVPRSTSLHMLVGLVGLDSYSAIHDAIDRVLLPKKLEQAGSLRKTAEMLGISRWEPGRRAGARVGSRRHWSGSGSSRASRSGGRWPECSPGSQDYPSTTRGQPEHPLSPSASVRSPSAAAYSAARIRILDRILRLPC